MLLLRRLAVGPAVACILSQVLGAFGGALLALAVVGKNALPTLSQKVRSLAEVSDSGRVPASDSSCD
eukprot:978-Eustigmatos_ZCMA.PRE.1